MINLELYRIFVIVANEGNITRASEILCVSQPAITKQIKNLEAQLNIKLFERNNSGMKLTIEGNELYFKIKDAIKLISEVENEFRENRTIRVGARTTILSKIFSKGISKYYNSYPNAKVDIRKYEIEEMLQKLDEKQLDVVLTKRIDDKNYSNLKFISLGFLHSVFVTKNNSKYSRKVFDKEELKNEKIYINSIVGNPVSTRVLKQVLNLDDLSNNKNIRSLSSNAVIEILKQEDAIGFLTKEFILEELEENKLEVVKTSFEIEPTEFGIYYNKNNKFEQLNNFIECIKVECINNKI